MVVFTVGLGAAVLAYEGVAGWTRARADVEFERRARMVLGPLQAELDASLELAESMADVFGADLPISRRLFETVARGARVRHPQLHALEWAPRVPRGTEAAFEAAMRPETPGFRIADLAAASPPASMADRFPVASVYPLDGNRVAVGRDLASEPTRRRTIERAIESGRVVVTPILELAQGGAGFLVLVPSFAAGAPHESPADRWAAVRGLGVAVFGVDRLLDLVRPAATSLELETALMQGAIDDSRVRDARRSTLNSVWTVRSVRPDDLGGHVVDLIPDQATVTANGWYLRISAVPGAAFSPNPVLPWLGALGVGALAGLAGLLLLRTERTRQLAAALQASNARLAEEARVRTEAERVLIRHSALVSLSLDTSNVVAWHLDVQRGELTRSSAAGPITMQVPADPEARWAALFRESGQDEKARVVEYVQGVLDRRENECRFEFDTTPGEGPPRRIAVVGRFQRDARGRVVSFTGLEADVTERRRQEEERRQLHEHLQDTQRLESLGILAGGVAHDFNNLIMGIMGGLAVLEERCGGDETARRALGLIDRGATRAAALTRQLLAYAGREQATVETTALAEIVREILPLLETSAGKRVSLALHVDPEAPRVDADPTQLRQIVMNLVINAAEAMSASGGTVRIGVGAGTFDREALARAWPANDLPSGRYVVLRVQDSGCGMSRETQQRIFDPFFTTKFTGRGLGLAAVLGIVRAHRGAILVVSAPGRGATFTVLFPPSTAAAVPAHAPAAPERAWRGAGTVLVVDDEDIAREITGDVLRSAGFATEYACDGRHALDRLAHSATPFAAVVLDLTMPGPSGLDVHREIRRRHPALPVLLVSGYSVQDVRDALGNGMPTGFLQKPFRRAALVAALRTLLRDGSSLLPPG